VTSKGIFKFYLLAKDFGLLANVCTTAVSSTQTLLPLHFNIPFDHFAIMNPSEQQACQLQGKIEAFNMAVCTAVDGTIITLMGNRRKEMVIMVSAMSNMFISSC